MSKEPGQIAYEAWRQALQGGINPNFHTLPPWKNLKQDRKDVWAVVEKSFIDAQPCQHPYYESKRVFEIHDGNLRCDLICLKCGKEL